MPDSTELPLVQAPNPQPIAIPVPQAIQSLEPTKLKPPARVTAIAAGGDHSMAVTVGGTLLAFGCNKHGQLGTGDTLDRMVPTEVRRLPHPPGRPCSSSAAFTLYALPSCLAYLTLFVPPC